MKLQWKHCTAIDWQNKRANAERSTIVEVHSSNATEAALKDMQVDEDTAHQTHVMNVLGQMREHMSTHRIRKLWWIDTRDMLADGLNKGAVSRRALVKALTQGVWNVEHPTVHKLSKGMILAEQTDTAGDFFVRRGHIVQIVCHDESI